MNINSVLHMFHRLYKDLVESYPPSKEKHQKGASNLVVNWVPSPIGILKANTYAACPSFQRNFIVAAVAHNSFGMNVGSVTAEEDAGSVLQADLKAILLGLKLVSHLSVSRVFWSPTLHCLGGG